MTKSRAAGFRVAFLPLAAAAALAGGSPENMLVLVDPSRPDALELANYYQNARQIPAANILYVDPTAPDYSTFVDRNLDMLFGYLDTVGLRDHIDYIIIAPPSSFYVNAPGLVTDGCVPVFRFSLSGAYTLAFFPSEILNGDVSTRQAGYKPFSGAPGPVAFDSEIKFWNGVASTDPNARQYFISGMLGWTGSRGNTVGELKAMIDRSVAVDGTRPGGTFYFMETTDPARSDPRDGKFDSTIATLASDGATGVHLFDVLPAGHNDCLGIMTGWATPDIDGTSMTLVPGAFCDHLTSFAATFDEGSQVKMSRWIAKGASGTSGTVEEPCNYAGKFVVPNVHVQYYRGLSLGESVLRALDFLPFQTLTYGDLMTRPWAYLPQIQVNDAPAAPVSGTITLTPSGTTAAPGAAMAGFDLLIDGLRHSSVTPGGQFTIDTTQLADGWHELRVLGFDNVVQKRTNRWIGTLTVDNHGRTTTLGITPASGDLSTPFMANIAALGGTPQEVRLVQNSRVVAAATGATGSLTIHGKSLGAGTVALQAEALYADGRIVRSAPFDITIDSTAASPTATAPTAYGFSKHVNANSPFVLELPATNGNPADPITYTIVTSPLKTSVPTGQSGSYRLMRPLIGASGTDTLTFRADSSAGSSATVTVKLIYSSCSGDIDADGDVDLSDLGVVLAGYGTPSGATLETGDLDGDGDVDLSDLGVVLARFGQPCQ